MTAGTQARHTCGAHQKFRLTCRQLDQLREDADGRCQICGSEQSGTGQRALSIDHDSALGYWAVRGLLCAGCNTHLDSLAGSGVDTYLANPWWSRVGLTAPVVADHIEIPEVDQDAARRMLESANAAYRDVQGVADRAVLKRARSDLRHAVRVAMKSGMRQADIARAIDHTWTKDQVYAARFEKGRRVV